MRKLIITNDFQKQIDLFHAMVGSIEWSGVLFYQVNTDLSDNNCIITPKYIFPMDVGVAAYTDFEYSDVIFDAYDQLPGAEDCREGIVHTHHRMGAFFSGTDDTELKENADKYDFYLSLVVDYNRTYKAKVATKPTSAIAVIDRPSGRYEMEIPTTAVLMLDVDVEYEEDAMFDTSDPMVVRMNTLLESNKVRIANEKAEAEKKKANKAVEKYTPGYKYENFNKKHSGMGSGPELPFQKENTTKAGETHTSNKGITSKDVHLEFLTKWLSQDFNCEQLLYRTLVDIHKEYSQYKKPQDRQDSLDFYESVLEQTFDSYFAYCYGMSMESYINTHFSKNTSPAYLLDKFHNSMSAIKADKEFGYLVNISLRVFTKLRKEIEFIYDAV